MTRKPHLVLDGAVVAARLLGAREIVIACDEGRSAAIRSLEHAWNERAEPRGRDRVSLTVAGLPGRYLTGQESALINALNRRPAKPSVTPPDPFERGVARRPTLVSNVETVAHLGLIARDGADWYRGIGSDRAPGSRLVTVSGAVARAGVIEVAGGTDIATVLRAAGGLTEDVRGVLLGGYGGSWVSPQALSLVLEEPALRELGLTLGAGILHVLGESTCPVAEVASVARWLEREGAGQCGPCVRGLDAITAALEELCEDGNYSGAYQRIERWCAMVTGRGVCAHPDGAARFVSSALRIFRTDFDDHARHGRCAACLGDRSMPTAPAGGLVLA